MVITTDSQAWTKASFCHVGSNINPVSGAICNVWKAVSITIGKCTDISTGSWRRTQVFFPDGNHSSSYAPNLSPSCKTCKTIQYQEATTCRSYISVCTTPKPTGRFITVMSGKVCMDGMVTGGTVVNICSRTGMSSEQPQDLTDGR